MCESESSEDEAWTGDFFNIEEPDWNRQLEKATDNEYRRLQRDLELREYANTLAPVEQGPLPRPTTPDLVRDRCRKRLPDTENFQKHEKRADTSKRKTSLQNDAPTAPTVDVKRICFDPSAAFRTDDLPTGLHAARTVTHSFRSITAHKKPITATSWAPPPFGQLLLTASLDGCVKLWQGTTGRCLYVNHEPLGIRCARFSLCGRKIFRCGWDGQLVLLDPTTGTAVFTCRPSEGTPSCLRPDPSNEAQVFVGSRDVVSLWDTRQQAGTGPARRCPARCGEVLDLLPLHDGREIACSGDMVARDSCRAALSVWDVGSGAPLSGQLFQERYTITCLEELPGTDSFLAQTNGNYVALFAASHPYRLDKRRRFEGHRVSGHPVRCSPSPDGSLLCSGDAEGVAHIYKVRTGAVSSLVALSSTNPAVTHPHWHPSRPGLMALGCADGLVHLCK